MEKYGQTLCANFGSFALPRSQFKREYDINKYIPKHG